jgi:DNA-binding transcriptional LysR family regulator
MNLALLDTFAAVMKTGSATGAAALLRVSQPAVSRALRRLEDTSRLRLFERQGKRLVPTPEARLLHAELLAAQAGLDRVRQAAARLAELGTGLLRVGSSAAFGLHLVPRVLQTLLSTRPGISVSFEIASSAVVRDRVAAGTFDVGLCADELDLANVAWEFLAAPPGVIVMPAAHPLAARPEIRARDLGGMPWIALAPEDRARRRLETVLGKAGVRVEVAAETPFSATVCEFAALGMGIGLANSLAFAAGGYATRGLVARPFVPHIPFRSLILLPAGPARSVLVKDFVSCLRAEIEASGRQGL